MRQFLTSATELSQWGGSFRNSSLTVEDVRVAPLLDDLRDDIQYHIDNHHAGATAFNRSFDFDFLENRGFQFRKKLSCPMLLSTPICNLTPVCYGSFKWPEVAEAWAYFFPDDALHEARIVFELYQRGVLKL